MTSTGNDIDFKAGYLLKVIFLLSVTALLTQCSEKVEEELPEKLSVELVAHDVTVFRGSDGSVKAVVTGGIAPYSFSWSNGETTEEIKNLSAGVYSVVVRDAVDSIAAATTKVNQPVPGNSVADREGNIYPTVMIGEQVWMQENLRVKVAPDSSAIVSYVYNDDPENAMTYGRLYTWDVAMNGSMAEKAQGICPVGWHIPSDSEWKTLEVFLGMTSQEADLDNTWRGAGVGSKLAVGGGSGSDALFAGRRTNYGSYSLLNLYEYVWTSTVSGPNAWRRCLENGVSTVGRWDTFPRDYAFSIRCIKD